MATLEQRAMQSIGYTGLLVGVWQEGNARQNWRLGQLTYR